MNLVFPARVLDQHLVVLGKTGSGKSSALRHIVEHLLDHTKRVCVIDPKGDWLGLKWSADGKGPGYPVILFGDFKDKNAADVPINAQSGKQIAELIATGNRPCVIGFRGWMTSHLVKFWIDFASTIFQANQGELYMVIDECHNLAPKGKIMDPDAGKCLHWSNRLINEGRGLGISCFIASQRPQKVHNDTLTACETLVAMRVIHKADRDAVEDWIEGCGDQDGGTVLNQLAGMPRGEAIVWSPEIGFGPKHIKFPMFSTFDSFAPPQLQKKVLARGWENVDLDDVRSKLAKVIEEQKANDPAELKRTIADLKRKLSEVERKGPEVKPSVVEVPVLDAAGRQTLEATINTCKEVLGALDKQGHNIALNLSHVVKLVERADRRLSQSCPVSRPQLRQEKWTSAPKRQVAITNGHESISGGLRRMLIALAQRSPLTKKQLGVRAGLSSSSGTFGTYLGRLKSNGWIEGSDQLEPTQKGLEALGSNYEPLPEGEELYRYWLRDLGNSGAARMLTSLFEAYPNSLTKEQLGERADISSTSGTFGVYLGKLKTLELVEGRLELKLSEELAP